MLDCFNATFDVGSVLVKLSQFALSFSMMQEPPNLLLSVVLFLTELVLISCGLLITLKNLRCDLAPFPEKDTELTCDGLSSSLAKSSSKLM